MLLSNCFKCNSPAGGVWFLHQSCYRDYRRRRLPKTVDLQLSIFNAFILRSLLSAHEIGESDPRSSPFFGKIFSVRSWLRSQIGSLSLEETVTPTARKCKL